MTQAELTSIYNRTKLMLNLERSRKLSMTPELREEAEILCFYLVRRYKSNGEIAKVETYRKYGTNETKIRSLISKWKVTRD